LVARVHTAVGSGNTVAAQVVLTTAGADAIGLLDSAHAVKPAISAQLVTAQRSIAMYVVLSVLVEVFNVR
jgi:hypothetical protein